MEKITSREEFQIEGIEFTHDRQAHRLIGYDTEGQKWIAPFNPDTGEVGHFSGSQKNGLPRERFLDLRRIFKAAGQKIYQERRESQAHELANPDSE